MDLNPMFVAGIQSGWLTAAVLEVPEEDLVERMDQEVEKEYWEHKKENGGPEQ